MRSRIFWVFIGMVLMGGGIWYVQAHQTHETHRPYAHTISEYLDWIKHNDPHRAALVRPVLQHLDKQADTLLRPPTLFKGAKVAVRHASVHDFLGRQTRFDVLTWFTPEEDDPTIPTLACEILIEDEEGVRPIACGLLTTYVANMLTDSDALLQSPPTPHLKVLDDHWLYAVFGWYQDGGTGMSTDMERWYQISDHGVKQVLTLYDRMHDANTLLWVQSGVRGSHLAVLNGRPALFTNYWVALVPMSDGRRKATGHGQFYCGVAVRVQRAELEPFLVDNRYSSFNADQVDPWKARQPGLWDHKQPDSVYMDF